MFLGWRSLRVRGRRNTLKSVVPASVHSWTGPAVVRHLAPCSSRPGRASSRPLNKGKLAFLGCTVRSKCWYRQIITLTQISFEPGFAAYQSLAQKIKVSFSRFFSFFLQFWGFEGDFKTRAKPRYAPNSGGNAFRLTLWPLLFRFPFMSRFAVLLAFCVRLFPTFPGTLRVREREILVFFRGALAFGPKKARIGGSG